MFLGQYEHTIDDKSRMTIPARFRELLDEGAYITQGFDKNLIVLTASDFDIIYERVNQMSMTDPNARKLRRLIFSNAQRVEFDKIGRIVIPQFLRQSADLENSAIVSGVGNYFEIWSPQNWEHQNNDLQDPDTNAQRYAALDLTF